MRASALARFAWTVTVGAAYVWPLEQPAAPTSTFGEYRSRHFHGGLDLSTQEIVGFPVRALEAGEVVRVRASGVGYGRALYLRLADGRTAVYGHLDGFAPDLERWLAAVQDSTGQYEQDLVPAAGRFRCGRGGLVGYGGASGAGPAHLHVELRAGETGLNPLTSGLAAPDTVPPSFTALWVYPAAADACVEGSWVPARIAARTVGRDVFCIERPIRVRGAVRVAVEVFDRTEAKHNRLAVHALEAGLDGEKRYEVRFDSVSWLAASEVEVVYDPRARAAGFSGAYALTPPAGLACAVLGRSAPSWLVPPGEHRLEVIARDVAGNAARLEARLVWLGDGEAAAGGWAAGGRRRARTLEVDWGPGRVSVRAPRAPGVELATRPALAEARPARGADEADRLWAERSFVVPAGFLGPLMVVGARRGSAPDTVALRSFAVGEVEPGWRRTLRSADGRLELEFGRDAVFERQPVAIEMVSPPAMEREPARAGGRPRGGGSAALAAYRVEPGWLPLRESVAVTLRLEEGVGVGGVGLFASGPDGTRFVGGPDSAEGGLLRGRIRSLGKLTALRDILAPTVGEARVRGGGRAPAPGARPAPLELRWRAADGGAGIEAAKCALEIDGRRVAVEYDPEGAALVWRPPDRPAAGRHAYRLEAVDRLGNRAVRAGAFRIR